MPPLERAEEEIRNDLDSIASALERVRLAVSEMVADAQARLLEESPVYLDGWESKEVGM